MTKRTLDDVTPAEWDSLRRPSVTTDLGDAHLLAHTLRRYPEGSAAHDTALEILTILLTTRGWEATKFVTGNVNRMLQELRDGSN